MNQRLTLRLIVPLGILFAGSAVAQSPCAPDAKEPGCSVEPAESSPSWLDDAWDGLPQLESADGAFSLELGGRLQLDYRDYHGERAPDNELLIRRARVKVEGSLTDRVEYKLQTEFNGGETPEIKDGYLDLGVHNRLRIQLGRLKAPFSQEELQSSKYVEFVERSLLNNLAPGRSLGVLAYGATPTGRVQYEAAVMSRANEFLADTSGATGVKTRRQTEISGRGRFKLVDSGIFENLHFGGAVGYGTAGGESAFELETSTKSFDLVRPVGLKGTTTRQNLEAWWRYENVAVQSEYLHFRGERRGLGDGGSDLDVISANGIMLQAVVVLTGENKSEKGIHPRRPFRRQGGFGAVELAVRYDFLEWSASDLGNRVDSWTAGVNWWLFDRVVYRVDANWDHFRVPPFRADRGDKTRFTVLSRIQIFF